MLGFTEQSLMRAHKADSWMKLQQQTGCRRAHDALQPLAGRQSARPDRDNSKQLPLPPTVSPTLIPFPSRSSLSSFTTHSFCGLHWVGRPSLKASCCWQGQRWSIWHSYTKRLGTRSSKTTLLISFSHRLAMATVLFVWLKPEEFHHIIKPQQDVI